MTEQEWEYHFPSHRIHGFCIKLAENLYLSDERKGVDYKKASIFRDKNVAYHYANKYKGQVEIIDLSYSMVGIYQREPLEYPKAEEN